MLVVYKLVGFVLFNENMFVVFCGMNDSCEVFDVL